MQFFSAEEFTADVTIGFVTHEVNGAPYAAIANAKVKPVFQELHRLRHDLIAAKKQYAELNANYQKLWREYYRVKKGTL